MDSLVLSPRPSKRRRISNDDAYDELFTQILQAFAGLDALSHPGESSIFIVYAHDNEHEGVAAHADCVRRIIDWLKTLRCEVLSDKSPLGRWASRGAEMDAVRNIISNQLRLLPSPGVTGVDKVIICGSPLLEKYYNDGFTSHYVDSIRRAYVPGDKEQNSIKRIVETQCRIKGFHHVLTELAFLELRTTVKKDHGIIPLSLNGGDLLYLPFFQRSDLRLQSETSTKRLHALLFKLLHQIYPKKLELIESFQRCYKNACERIESDSAILIEEVRSIGQQEISKSLDYWQKHQEAAIRHISQLRENIKERQGPSSQHIIPFKKNIQFVGRASVLKNLREWLSDSSHQSCAVVGLGGVGKTQVVLQIAYWVKEHMTGWSVFWLPAVSTASFQQACTDIARNLNLQGVGKEDPKELVRGYLASDESGRCLVVVDNADDKDILFGTGGSKGIYDYLPDHDHSRLLFTTRSKDVALDVNGDLLDLEKMSAEEGKILWKQLAPKEAADDATTEKLLCELAYLPLAISQAAAYLKRNQTTIGKYLELLGATEKEVVSLMSREFRDPMRYKESRHAVAMTWLVSFQQIRKTDIYAAEILSFLSQIEPRAIPKSLLPRSRTEEDLINAIGTLRGYAFLEQRGEDDMFDMHRLVHLAARVWIKKMDRSQETKQAAITHMADIFPSDDWENRLLWRQYFPHALLLVRGASLEHGISGANLGYLVGVCLMVDGRIREAVGVLQPVVVVWEKTLAEDHPDLLASQHALAIAYQANGQVKQAIKLLEQVVTVEEKTLAEDHPDRLASLHELACAYQANGQVKQAINLLEQVVAIKEKTLAEDHPDRLASQHELASAYQANGQIKQAINLLKQVVAIEEKTLAEDHPNRLASLHELACAYQANGQVKQAIKLLEQVVAIEEKTLAEDHPDRLASQQALALAYRTQS